MYPYRWIPLLGTGGGTYRFDEADAVLVGEGASASTGYAVAGAGDVNGDGYDDLLVGAPDDTTGAIEAGAAYLVDGGG